MNARLLESLQRPFAEELPHLDYLDQYLDFVLPVVRHFGEDLQESHFYLGRPWLEIRDDDHFHDAVLHFFNEPNEYIRSVNGNVSRGTWRFLGATNKFIIDHQEKKDAITSELYDLAYLDGQFFILRKHGDQPSLGNPKYFLMVIESQGRGLSWLDAVELLYNRHRQQRQTYLILTLIALMLIFIALFMWTY